MDGWMSGQMDGYIHTYMHTCIVGRQTNIPDCHIKIIYFCESWSKCLKTAILDHLLAWKRERGRALGFFQYWLGSTCPLVYPKHFSLLLP